MKVAVIGGAGHVGLGMCLIAADAGHFVYGVDIDEERMAAIRAGRIPFYEENGEEYLGRALDAGRLEMTSDVSVVGDADVVIVVLGTPVDENLNPELAPLRNAVRGFAPYVRREQLIVLRSTVSPETTRLIRRLLEEETGLECGTDFFLVYAPERVVQGRVISEMTTIPQIIGAVEDEAFERAASFFRTFNDARMHRLTPLEAEISKLVANVARYVNFALVNELHLIADTYGVNINRIIDASNDEYPRLDLPSPGPNVGGPCLHKDGWFLIERIPYTDLISTAFRINEGMPMHIIQKLRQHDGISRVGVLGLAFKADSDDVRNSVSLKLRKQLDALGYQSVFVDPHVPEGEPVSALAGCEAVVLMTPHSEFSDLGGILEMVGNPDCLYVDIWGFWPRMRHTSRNGFFYGREVPTDGARRAAKREPARQLAE